MRFFKLEILKMINLLSESAYIAQTNKIKTAITNKVNAIKASFTRIGAKLGTTINWLDDVESTLDDELTAINTELVNKGSTQADDFSEVAEKISDIQTGITPTGTINITENGTYDVTNYASAAVAVAGVRTVTLTQTLTANANDIKFTHSEGEAPKAVILRSKNATHIKGEIYYATCVGNGGYGECKNLETGNKTQDFYSVGQTGLYNRVIMGTTTVYFNRIISNSMFPADVPYELTMYFWDEVSE